MALVKLIDPDGNEVVTNENGVEALKKAGYKDAPKPKASAKKKDEPAEAEAEAESSE